MKTSKALKIVKQHVAKSVGEDGFKFICHATDAAERLYLISYTNAVEIKQHICVLLGWCDSLDNWLMHYCNINTSAGGISANQRFNKLQTTRHAWINDMIAYFEAKGD